MLSSFGIENGGRRGKWIPSKDSGDLAKDTLLGRSGARRWGELKDRLSICSSIIELIIYILHRNLFDSRRYKIGECLGRGCAGRLEEMSFEVSKFRNSETMGPEALGPKSMKFLEGQTIILEAFGLRDLCAQCVPRLICSNQCGSRSSAWRRIICGN